MATEWQRNGQGQNRTQRNYGALELLRMSVAGLPPQRRAFTCLRRQVEGLGGGRA